MEPMLVAPSERKTCIACTKAKRKCDKGTPVCQRCVNKGVDCQYPNVRRYTRLSKKRARTTSATNEPLVSSELSPGFWDSIFVEPGSSADQDLGAWVHSEEADLEHPEAVDLSLESPAMKTMSLDGWWLSGPEVWEVDRSVNRCHDLPPNHVSILNLWIDEIREWLRQWIDEGHNAFIHKHLYSCTGLPICLQDCWSALSAYMLKTKSNQIITMSIVQSRADILTAERMIDGDPSNNPPMLSTTDHLARVQALFIYQFIRLFDGDIRQRVLAEEQFFVLQEWSEQLWESAASSLCTGNVPWSAGIFDKTDPEARLWEKWVLGESVRRTWYLSKILHCVYFTLRDGWTVCPGAVYFTAQKDVWEADSPTVWAELAQNQPLLLTSNSRDDDRLFTKAKFSEVDPYSRLLLKLLWGSQRVQAWARDCSPI